MPKNIGIIGNTGRMGKLLLEVLQDNKDFQYSKGYSRHNQTSSLAEVFLASDCVIDFSVKELLPEVLANAKLHPKPLLICTTGWQLSDFETKLKNIAKFSPVMIAANTSLGAWLQRYLVREAARILDESYDLDILERHHKHKKDSPSGTAKHILADLNMLKPNINVGIHAIRAGNIVGEHEISFTSGAERITITHEVFDRKIFAIGALRLAKWLLQADRKPGLYTVDDAF